MPPPEKPREFTDEELELLTDEEREGLLEGEAELEAEEADAAAAAAEEEGVDIKPAVADDPEPAPDDDDTDENDGKENADDKKAADDKDAKPADAPEPDKPEQKPETPAPEPDAAAPENDAEPESDAEIKRAEAAAEELEKKRERIDAIKTELDELAVKFDEGDLTAKEYQEQQLALNDERTDLRVDVRTVETRAEDAVTSWQQDIVPGFLEAHEQYKPGSVLYGALDAQVRHLQETKYASNQHDPRIMQEAHEKIKAELPQMFGNSPTPPPPPPPTPDPATTGKKPDKKPAAKPAIPPNLGNLPAADMEEIRTDGGKFAYLDRLEGEAYEDALAKLSDADQEAYLAS